MLLLYVCVKVLSHLIFSSRSHFLPLCMVHFYIFESIGEEKKKWERKTKKRWIKRVELMYKHTQACVHMYIKAVYLYVVFLDTMSSITAVVYSAAAAAFVNGGGVRWYFLVWKKKARKVRIFSFAQLTHNTNRTDLIRFIKWFYGSALTINFYGYAVPFFLQSQITKTHHKKVYRLFNRIFCHC